MYHIPFTSSISCHFRPQALKTIHFLLQLAVQYHMHSTPITIPQAPHNFTLTYIDSQLSSSAYSAKLTHESTLKNTQDNIWSNQLYDTFNGIFLLDITDHYPIFAIVPINCPQKRIHVKFIDQSRQSKAKLKLEVGRYVNNHVQINQDVSSNTNNSCNNLFVIYSNCYPIEEKEISFARLRKPWISDAIMISLNRKHELFRQYKNGIVIFDHYNSFKNNFTTILLTSCKK